MKLYDHLIRATMDALADRPVLRFSYAEQRPWPDRGSGEFIMQRDAALELGGAGEPSVNYTLTTTGGMVAEDEILVCGPDLPALDGRAPFARIVLLETGEMGEEDDTERAFQVIRNLEFVRYHVFPEGYMVRVSASSNEEQVRVCKEAIRSGITFARVGACYLQKYLAEPAVKHAKVIFITERTVVDTLKPHAEQSDAITKTLTHILDGMPTDCGHCSMKAVCDEVEGIKEMHFKRRV